MRSITHIILYWKLTSIAWGSLGLRGYFLRPHLFMHPIPCYTATQRHWKKCRSLLQSSLKGLRHIPYEATLSYTPTTQCAKSPMASMESTFTHLTHVGPRGHAYRFHQQRYCTRRRQYAFTLRAAPFWNKLTLPSRHSWTPIGSPCSQYSYNPPPPTTHSLCTHWPTWKKLTSKWPFPQRHTTTPSR